MTNHRELKTTLFTDFKAKVAQAQGVPNEQVRLWVLVNRQNKTVRPDVVVPENDPALTLETVRDRMASRANDLRFYVEILGPSDNPDNSLMIFLKYFDVSRQTLAGVSRIYVQKGMKVGDLIPKINEIMLWPPNTQVRLYEEIKPGMIEQMKNKATFAQSEIQDGDIICFQMDIPEKDAQDYETQSMYSNPIQFYDFLQNQIKVMFKPKFDDVDYKNEIEVTLSKKMTYDMVSVLEIKFSVN